MLNEEDDAEVVVYKCTNTNRKLKLSEIKEDLGFGLVSLPQEGCHFEVIPTGSGGTLFRFNCDKCKYAVKVDTD